MKHRITIFIGLSCLLMLCSSYAADNDYTDNSNVCTQHPAYETRMIWNHHCNAQKIMKIAGPAVIDVKPQQAINGIPNYCVTLDKKKMGFFHLTWLLFKAGCY